MSIEAQIIECMEVKKKLLKNKEAISRIDKIANRMVQTYQNGNKILLCGNGGSAADAQHMAGELVGRFKRERKGLPAIAIATNVAVATAVSNDYGYIRGFVREVEAFGSPGDLLIAISTSGNSANVVHAIEKAHEMGISTVLLSGIDGGRCREIADMCLLIPSDDVARIQENHIMVAHILCDLVEKKIL